MPYYRPRMLAVLDVPVLGTRAERINQAASTESLSLTVQPKSCRIARNSHNEADRCSLTLDWFETGMDPRMLDNAVVTVWMDNADEEGRWGPAYGNTRFVGLAKDISTTREPESAAEVTLECVDYTTLFLDAKPFGSSGVPLLSDTLQEAWERVVSQTPGAEALAGQIQFEGGVFEDDVIGKASAARFRKKKLGVPIVVNPAADAWAVWQQCVGMLGLISYIHLDRCIVTTATNLYTEENPPILIWGKNIGRWSETRHAAIAGKGVGLASFDPIKGETIESYFPPLGDDRVKKKKSLKSKKIDADAKARLGEDREYFTVPGIATHEGLFNLAKRVWEERSRQELEGVATTSEMWVETVAKPKTGFDMLTLRAGDSIRVTLDPKHRQTLASLPTDGARVLYLTNRGYSEDAANLIARNWKEFAALDPTYYVKTVEFELQSDNDTGSFEVTINYVNRIAVDGSAKA